MVPPYLIADGTMLSIRFRFYMHSPFREIVVTNDSIRKFLWQRKPSEKYLSNERSDIEM